MTYTQPNWNVNTVLNIAGLDANALDVLVRQASERRGNQREDRLYHHLINLNFSAQRRAFLETVKSRSIAALLIDGAPDHGQRWLLNRLLQRFDPCRVLPIDMRVLKQSYGLSMGALCHEIGKHAHTTLATPAEAAQVLCDLWANQTTVLLLRSFDRVGERFASAIVEQLWATVVATSLAAACAGGPTKLLLVLEDGRGLARGWKLPLAAPGAGDTANVVALPALARITAADLHDWIDRALLDLPDSFGNADVQSLLDDTDNGVPEQVLELICSMCDVDWHKGAAQWLKH